ncbi:MAG TPA: lysylphosphatidylglycerol synthase transmembrane domain-containing protein [Candidatus Ozemobacteraceae bacterium]|nr:lysylphosphatidylglycerol synthase transmembrane domain-containing protein [Candidatus Ozemobacteraceae bacterium]
MQKAISLSSIILRLSLWLAVAAVLFLTATAMFADFDRVIKLLSGISLQWLGLIILAVLFNYALRFAKWSWFLRLLNIRVPFKLNLWVFFSAFTMVLSPAKLGELVKSLLLKNRLGIPISATAPIIMAERLTDLIGLLILCAAGFSQFAYGGRMLLLTGALIASGVICLTRPSFWNLADRALNLHPKLAGLKSAVRAMQQSTGSILNLKAMMVSVPLSAISWAGEGVALFMIFRAMGLQTDNLPAISIFAHAFGSIAGALSFLPGGLLVTEGTMGMFFVFAAIPEAQAVSATFLIRALTLWFAVCLGTLVFAFGHQRSDLQAFTLSPESGSSCATGDQ